MKAQRVVLDTNCLISALIFKNGRLPALRHAWQGDKIRPIVCRETVAELIRVLAYPKFRLSDSEIDTLLAEFLPFAETQIINKPTAPVPGLGDYSDAVFVHLAIQSKAAFLVSGDAHLIGLALAEIRVLAPAAFLEIL